MERMQKPEAMSEEDKSLSVLRDTLAYVARELSQLPNAPARAARGVDEAFQALNTVLSPKTAKNGFGEDQRLN